MCSQDDVLVIDACHCVDRVSNVTFSYCVPTVDMKSNRDVYTEEGKANVLLHSID